MLVVAGSWGRAAAMRRKERREKRATRVFDVNIFCSGGGVVVV